jgi:hypothetical protein
MRQLVNTNKPKFDPSKPFQAADQMTAKPKFDPSQPFEAADGGSAPKEETSMLEAILRGFASGASSGQSEPAMAQFNAGAETGNEEAILDAANPMLSVGSLANFEKSDDAMKDIVEKRLAKTEALKKEYPVASFLSEMGGAAVPTNPGNLLFGTAFNEVGKGLKALGLTDKIANAASAVKKSVGKGATKIASTTSGVAEDAIETYSKNPQKVDALIEKFNANVPEAVDAVKRDINGAVQGKLSSLGNAKSAILESAANKKVNIAPVLETIESAKSKINPKLNPEALTELQSLQNRLVQAADGFEASPKTVEEIKSYLQDLASPSYNKGGQIIPGGDKVAKAAKQAAAIARKEINKVVPEVASVNNQFEQLYSLQRVMNRNLLKEGGSEAALLSAGKAANRNRKNLEKLSEIVGQDFLDDIKNVSAMSEFAKPDLLAKDFSGKAFLRASMGGAAGTAVGGPIGGAVGALATSPAAVKKAIRLKALLQSAAPEAPALLSGSQKANAILQALDLGDSLPAKGKNLKRLRVVGE